MANFSSKKTLIICRVAAKLHNFVVNSEDLNFKEASSLEAFVLNCSELCKSQKGQNTGDPIEYVVATIISYCFFLKNKRKTSADTLQLARVQACPDSVAVRLRLSKSVGHP